MKRATQTLIVIAFAILGLTLSVTAQADRNRPVEVLRAEIDRTDQLIERADPLIMGSGNQVAITTLDRARDLQSRAREEFAKGTVAGYASARKLTMLAREQVQVALKLIGGTPGNVEQQDDFVLRKLESVSSLLDRALESLATQPDQNLVQIGDVAKNNLDRAWEFYRNKQYRPAVKLAEQVEKAANKILSESERGAMGLEDFDRVSGNVRQFMEQVRQEVAGCNSTTATGYLTEADQAYQLALQLHERQRTGAAMQALQRARELAMKAGRECRGLDRLQARYDQLSAELNRVRNSPDAPVGPSADAFNQLLSQAQEQLALANRHINDGDFQAAAVALQAAQIAIRQAEALMKQTG